MRDRGFQVVEDRDQRHRFVAKVKSHRDVMGKRSGGIIGKTTTVVLARTEVTITENGADVASVSHSGDAMDSSAYAMEAAMALVDKLMAGPLSPE